LKNTVVILGESSFINFAHLRHTLIRIPEVAEVLAEAQKYWDTLRGVKSLDLNNSFYNTDDFFMIHPEYKNFLTDLVQFALFQRLRNQGQTVEYVFSNVSTSRSHLLILGLQNLKEFVFKHPAVRSFNKEPKSIRSLHAVHAETKFSLHRFTSCGLKNIKTSPHATEVLQELENEVDDLQFLNLGLGQNVKFLQSLTSEQVKYISESVLLDEKLKPIFQTYFELDLEASSIN
jgi:hypothetical protein